MRGMRVSHADEPRLPRLLWAMRQGRLALAMSNPRRSNGSRRDKLRARVLAEEDRCALGGELVDRTLGPGLPGSPEVDEDIPVSRGGSPYDRANCHLMCRAHNQFMGAMTLAEARAKLAGESNVITTTTLIRW